MGKEQSVTGSGSDSDTDADADAGTDAEGMVHI